MASNKSREPSRYVVYPLLVITTALGVIAVREGVRSGIPFLAAVGCFFGAWLAHTKSTDGKTEYSKVILILLGLVFIVIAIAINE